MSLTKGGTMRERLAIVILVVGLMRAVAFTLDAVIL